MVHFQKRITDETLREINERIHIEEVKKNDKNKKQLKRKKTLRKKIKGSFLSTKPAHRWTFGIRLIIRC